MFFEVCMLAWYKSCQVKVKTLQQGGSTATPVHREGFSALCDAANADVQLYSGGSCMQPTCFFCSGHILPNISSRNRGTPSTSVAGAMVANRESSRFSVVSAPLMCLRQCRASSFLPTARCTASDDGFLMPFPTSSCLLAAYRESRSC